MTEIVQRLDAGNGPAARGGAAQRDRFALAIALAAIALFVATGGPAVTQSIRLLMGTGLGPNPLLTSAVLLNIALILFGWMRHKQLSREVRDSREGEAEARMLAERDALTGLLNRRCLTESIEVLVAQSEGDGQALAFLLADLDGFKHINDYHGHSAGDAVLRQCAQRLIDVLPENSVKARLGGDEFACLIPFPANQPERIDRLANDLIEAIAAPFEIEQSVVQANISLGIARSDHVCSDEVENGDDRLRGGELMHAADVAMYHAKKQGRNRYFWFEASMEHELRFRRQLEAGIRNGIAAGEFVPYYEQQIDLGTGKLTGFEMLARWHSPAFGTVSPETFIPIAEEIGVIDQLSQSLITQALSDAKEWNPQLTLSVNISPIQLRDPWFSQKLLKMLVEANFPPQRLEIEITESCLHENLGAVRTLLASLKNQGIQISLDDFGTGYASLGQLRDLPFDRIKIDRSFVMTLADNSDSATIVRAISSLGQGLGLPITAEGIETETILAQLRQFGEFKGQGYLYGRPEPADATTRRLEALNLLQTARTAVPQAEIVNDPAFSAKAAPARPPRKRKTASR